MSQEGKSFILYGNSYCHLCEEMHTALKELQPQYAFDVSVIDIDGEAELETKFGEKIPVLMLDDKEVCHYHLDGEAFRRCFR